MSLAHISSWASCHRQIRIIASGQLPGIHQKWAVASKCAWSKPHGLPCLGCDIGGPLPAPFKTQFSLRTQRIVAYHLWDSLLQEPINKAVKCFTLRLKRCSNAGGAHFEHTKWLSFIRKIVNFFVSVSLFAAFRRKPFSSARISLRWSH